jgi:hypothetical protein
MKKVIVILVLSVIQLLFMEAPTFAQLKRAIVRGATRSAARSLRLRPTLIKRLDLAKHMKTVPKPLKTERIVQRYTSKKQALHEAKRGLAPNTHMTAIAHRGRPLTGDVAKQRYGLLASPQVRETIRLTKGIPVRHNRATGAARGVWELTSPKRMPATVIKKITPLKKLSR